VRVAQTKSTKAIIETLMHLLNYKGINIYTKT